MINNNKIIASYSGVCAGVATLPIPFWDIFILTPIQVLMGKRIAQSYNITRSKKEIGKIVLEIFGAIGLGYIAQQAIVRFVYKLIPYWGAITTIPVVFAFSFAIGKIMDEYFYRESIGQTMSKSEIKKLFNETFTSKKREVKDMSDQDMLAKGDSLKDDKETIKEIKKIKKNSMK